MPIKYHNRIMRFYNLRVKRKLKCHPIQVLILRTRAEQNVPPPPCLAPSNISYRSAVLTACSSEAAPLIIPQAYLEVILLHFISHSSPFLLLSYPPIKKLDRIKKPSSYYIPLRKHCVIIQQIWSLSPQRTSGTLWPPASHPLWCMDLFSPTTLQGAGLIFIYPVFPMGPNASTLWVLTAYLWNEWMNDN